MSVNEHSLLSRCQNVLNSIVNLMNKGTKSVKLIWQQSFALVTDGLDL